jgi:regulator of replication initiation timing
MDVTETIDRTTKGQINRVQALMGASTQRLAERRAAIEAAEAARKDAVRCQALGDGSADGLAAAVHGCTEALAQARQELADEAERNAALKAEAKRLHDVLAAEQLEEKVEKVRRATLAAVQAAGEAEAHLVNFLNAYTAMDARLTDVMAVSPGLGQPINDVRDALFAAFVERGSYLPACPHHLAMGARPETPKYVNRTLASLIPAPEEVATWAKRGRAW